VAIKLVSEKNGHVLTFDEKSHRYKLDEKGISGVTTINKSGYPQSFFLTNWMIGQGAEFVAKKLITYYKWQFRKKHSKFVKPMVKQVEWIVKKAKQAFRRKSKEAADIGTIVHDYANAIECGKPFDMKVIKEHKDRKKIEKCLKKFTSWKKKNTDEMVASEEVVASPTYWFAGKFDRLVKRNGLVILSDFKTSSGIYVDMFVQLAGYAIAIKEWMGIDVNGIEIVRFGKDGSFDTKLVTDVKEITDYMNQFVRNCQTAQFRKQYEEKK